MTDGDEMDYEQHQQNEIDGAKADIEDRRDHLGDYRQNGLLDGDFVNDRENERLKAYLQGYADALDFAAERVGRIDNLARYAMEAEPPTDDEEVSDE